MVFNFFKMLKWSYFITIIPRQALNKTAVKSHYSKVIKQTALIKGSTHCNNIYIGENSIKVTLNPKLHRKGVYLHHP